MNMADSTTHYGLTKPLGSEYYNISVPNGNMDKIDTALHALGSGLAIIATGDTHAAAASGDFIYIHSHGTLAEGLYKATTSIAQNATLSGSNVTAATGGGLNTKVDKVSGKGLSTNDYTTTEKTKLAGIEIGAQVNPGNATTSAAGLMSATDKSDLDSLKNKVSNLKTPSAALGASYTVAASGTYKLNLKTTLDGNIPSGYKLLGIVGFRTGNDNVVPIRIEYQDNASSLTLRNLSNTSQNGTWGVDILIIPT
jgi:hypothetical protein